MDGGRARRRRCREYLLALEEERRKIQVFRRELPLCLDLVTQTIEGMRGQVDGVGSEETVSDHGDGPVLEEFIPLKPSLSLSSSAGGGSGEDSAHKAAAGPGADEKDEAAETPDADRVAPPPDWLQSVQLWGQHHPHHHQSFHSKKPPCKPVALKAGGAFHPFEKEKRAEAVLPASSTTTAAACSAVVGDSADKAAATSGDTEGHKKEDDTKDDVKDKEKDREGQSQPQPQRKYRRCWAPELHRRFLQALQQLGGSHAATPKQIRELMKVDGLTNDEVKSHLQKYRLHTRRPSSTVQSATVAVAAQPAPQFVVVGGIWVPPPEYAAAAAAAQPQLTARADADAPRSANPVYAPVATLARPHPRERSGRCSEGRRSGDTGGAILASPTVSSSSSQTTSA